MPATLGEAVRENRINILLVAAVVIVLVAVLLVVRSCSGLLSTIDQADFSGSVGSQEAYVSPYDWTCLDRTDGRYTYVVDGQVQSRLGVDVSEHQGYIDWDAVAADGIDFAYVRMGYRGTTEGDLFTDAYFSYNLSAAKAAGLDVGVYFYSQANTVEEAREEADFVVAGLAGAGLDYPIAFDSESGAVLGTASRTDGLSQDELTAIAQAFCEEVNRAGYAAVVYGNGQDLARFDTDAIEAFGVWYAEYNMPAPTANLDFVLWQYSNNGAVSGIDGAVDLDLDLREAYHAATSA